MSSKSIYFPCKSMPKKSHQTEHSIKREREKISTHIQFKSRTGNYY
jgi:hypothetical protein